MSQCNLQQFLTIALQLYLCSFLQSFFMEISFFSYEKPRYCFKCCVYFKFLYIHLWIVMRVTKNKLGIFGTSQMAVPPTTGPAWCSTALTVSRANADFDCIIFVLQDPHRLTREIQAQNNIIEVLALTEEALLSFLSMQVVVGM